MSYSFSPFADKEIPKSLSMFPELTARLLANRGLLTEEEARAFVEPRFEDMYDPFLMHDMERAVVRIFEAIEAKEKIVIYSDYDCDGIPGGTILHDLFKKIGYENFENYIPHRHDEGYGLNHDAVDEFIKRDVKLLITVDLGSTDVEEVTRAQVGGIDVIITDHHELPPELPRAFALVNPKVRKNTKTLEHENTEYFYPDPMLCGAGVAFKLVQAFLKKYGEYFNVHHGWEKWLLDMAGLGTLSDMVPLRNENRIFAYYGLMVLQKTKRPGLVSLLKKMNIEPRRLNEEDIGFMIAPRINAASRMDIPMRAFELLSTTDHEHAKTLADHLSRINDDRKTSVAVIMREINKRFKDREETPLIVVGNPSWNAGVLGLIASKIVETYNRPAFVWGGETDEGFKGSCRGDGTVNVVEVMRLTESTFLGFGGHEHAGGFSVSHEKVVILEKALCETALALPVREKSTHNGVQIDSILEVKNINSRTLAQIKPLAPFGVGNPRPVFLLKNVKLCGARHFGKENNHLEITICDERNNKIKAIKFFAGIHSFTRPLVLGMYIDLVCTIEESFFAGKNEIRLRILYIECCG